MLNREKASKLLDDVKILINGERAKSYGEPQESFKRIADFWSLYLDYKLVEEDVGMMMILLKIARNQAGPSLDNFIDICGYSALIGSEHVTDNK